MAKRDKAISLFFVLLFFAAIPFKLLSQATNGIGTIVGFNVTNIRDVSMSPLIYSGTGFSGGLNYQRVLDSKTKYFQLNYHQAELKSIPGNIAEYKGASSKNYTFYNGDSPIGKLVNFGWVNNNVFSLYDEVSFGNYGNRTYYFTSFGPSALFHYTFNLFDRAVELSLRSDFQLLGFYLRPSYISSAFEGFLDEENSYMQAIIKSIDVFFPNRSVNLGYHPEILYKISPSIDISFEYNYEFTRLKYPEPVSSSNGNWYFGLTFWL